MSSDGFLEAVRKVDPTLAQMLPGRGSLRFALKHLDETTDPDLLVEESFERRRVWQDAGLYYRYNGRIPDAIALFRHLYEKICEEQQQHKEWLPRGTPLVWISDCHLELGHPALSARYLLLTAVSDAVRDKGRVGPEGGVYWRARWLRGWEDEELDTFYSDCSRIYTSRDPLYSFPEHFLLNVRPRFILPYAAPSELDIYEVNKVYARKVLHRIQERSAKVTGKDLEMLAGYLLSCIPGFEVRSDVRADDTQYDGLVRNTGPKHDFRADLGFYLLVECKDWEKPVGVGEVSQFINKLILQDCRGGILFSSAGITGRTKADDAELQLLKAHYRAGKTVVVLNRRDFEEAAKGRSLISMLRQKYEKIRFDIAE